MLSAYIETGHIVPCPKPCNTHNLQVKKPNGKSQRFVKDLRSINAIILCHSVVPNPHTSLSYISKIVTCFL